MINYKGASLIVKIGEAKEFKLRDYLVGFIRT